jgi:hypothetical protein
MGSGLRESRPGKWLGFRKPSDSDKKVPAFLKVSILIKELIVH